jgi:hypothetical protein
MGHSRSEGLREEINPLLLQKIEPWAVTTLHVVTRLSHNVQCNRTLRRSFGDKINVRKDTASPINVHFMTSVRKTLKQ